MNRHQNARSIIIQNSIRYCLLFVFLAAGITLKAQERNKAAQIRPGQLWNDSKGSPINAHGGGILYYRGQCLIIKTEPGMHTGVLKISGEIPDKAKTNHSQCLIINAV